MAKEEGKTLMTFSVDTRVKEKFISAFGFKGVNKNKAIEEAMKLYTDKHIKAVGEGNDL